MMACACFNVVSAGVQPVVKLIGFGSGGLEAHQPAGGLTVAGAMGGIGELKALASYCAEEHILLYFDFDLLHFSRSGSGISRFLDTAKAPNRQASRLYPVQPALRSPNTGFPATYLVCRDQLPSLAERASAAAVKWGLTGISFNTAGNTAYSDYGNADGAVKGGTDTQYAALQKTAADRGLSLSSSEANAYAAVSSAHLFDVPLRSSGFLAFAREIPFYEMVFKGCVPMGSEPVNLSVDPQETVLRAAEAGCGLTYTLSGSFKKDYLDSPQPMLGSTYYADVLQTLPKQVARIDSLLKAVKGAAICSHRILGELREIQYDNGVTVLVNYGDTATTVVQGEVAARDFRIVAREGTK